MSTRGRIRIDWLIHGKMSMTHLSGA